MSATVIALATTLAIVLTVTSVLITLLYVQLRQKRSYHGAVEATPLTLGFEIFNFILPPKSFPLGCLHKLRFSVSRHLEDAELLGAYITRTFVDVEPGTNMHIAHRNFQGGWELFDTGFPENDKLPRPQSVRSSVFDSLSLKSVDPRILHLES